MKPPVLMVIPPSLFLLDERVFMSLGILRVAASLEAAGHEVEMLDLSGIENFEEVAGIHAAATAATSVCITVTTPQLPATTKIVARIRAVAPHLRIIAGGPHPTLVHSAVKLEKKAGRDARAHRALEQLLRIFDVVVSGDGENSVHQALRMERGLLDADDPKGLLFLTNKTYEASPMPARHLVDVESYKYTIDGVRAGSMIAQLGCLAAGTMIRMADGTDRPIEEVAEGDRVASYAESGARIDGPVEKRWRRSAPDMWELTMDSGVQLRITSEHPILTPSNGWVKVEELNVGEEVCLREVRDSDRREEDVQTMSKDSGGSDMPTVQERIRATASIRQGTELVQSRVQGQLAEDPREREMVTCRSECNAEEVGRYVSRGENRALEYRDAQGCGVDPSREKDHLRVKAWRLESDEAPRSGAGRIQDDQREVGPVLFGPDEGHVGLRQAKDDMGARGDISVAERIGDGVAGDHAGGSAHVSVRGQRSILDRSVSVGETAQPGLHRQAWQESDSAARGVLAHGGGCGCPREGLHREGMASADDLVRRDEKKDAPGLGNAASEFRRARLISKRWLGESEVFNITVCPGHCYVANGVVVHNCPFACGFCGGRNSNMLRRIRTRSTESIVAEIEHLYRTYGMKAQMLYDDELNVNKSLVPLMREIRALQDRLGVEFRFRGFVKSELFNAEQSEAMYDAGFRWLLCGFEAADPRILRNINKKATREDNDKVIETAHAHGLKVKALMSVGHPGESEQTIMAVRDWLISRAPDDFDVTCISTYPGTPYYDEALPHDSEADVWTYTARGGDRLHSYDVDYSVIEDAYKGIPGEYTSYVFTDYLSRHELVSMRNEVEDTVRAKLGIPFNAGAPGVKYDHSMGQGKLPEFILRRSA